MHVYQSYPESKLVLYLQSHHGYQGYHTSWLSWLIKAGIKRDVLDSSFHHAMEVKVVVGFCITVDPHISGPQISGIPDYTDHCHYSN